VNGWVEFLFEVRVYLEVFVWIWGVGAGVGVITVELLQGNKNAESQEWTVSHDHIGTVRVPNAQELG
jgi:hypothetical protein